MGTPAPMTPPIVPQPCEARRPILGDNTNGPKKWRWAQPRLAEHVSWPGSELSSSQAPLLARFTDEETETQGDGLTRATARG